MASEPWYISLLGLAERYRTATPPNYKMCIRFLQSIFHFKPPPQIEARTHLQLGTVLFSHTKNDDLARMHLDKAWTLSRAIGGYDEVMFETASLLSQLYEKKNCKEEACPVLQFAIDKSQSMPYWHCRMILQLAQLYTSEREFEPAVELLSRGAAYAETNGSIYTKIQFLLAKGMLLLVDKKLEDAHQVMTQAGSDIERYDHGGQPALKEALKVFFLVLQVSHFLMAGQIKSVKPSLKQLQQTIQTMTSFHSDDEPMVSSNPIDLFHWLPKEHMCVLVYLITVMHSMQAGYMEKAQKYTDKALMQIEKLIMVDAHPLLAFFQLMLLEHIILCRLIMGTKSVAIQEELFQEQEVGWPIIGPPTPFLKKHPAILQACQVCGQHPHLFNAHGCQIHTLLGLYAMSMNVMEAAELQFKTALTKSKNKELWLFIQLNLAIVYLRSNRHTELTALLEQVEPDTMSTCSHSLKASAFYVKGLQSFFQARYNEAKRYLRETLKMANAEELNRLTSCSLVLLGHIFLSLGNTQEALNMVTPAMQLASKIPDVHIQLWASALLKDLYRLFGNADGETEGTQLHEKFSQQLLNDHFSSSQLPEHKLIQWTDGDCPLQMLGTGSSAAALL